MRALKLFVLANLMVYKEHNDLETIETVFEVEAKAIIQFVSEPD